MKTTGILRKENKSFSIGIMQAYFFPYIGYFQLISEVDKFILYDHVSYRKRSWINKNRIKDKGNSSPVNIIVPIKKQTSFKLIKDIEVFSDYNWKKKIENLIFFNYKKALFFDEVFTFIKDILYYDSISLHQYNSFIIEQLCKRIGIRTAIVFENSKHQLIEDELEERALLNNNELKEQRVYELCRNYNADTYINPINGIGLYNFEKFEKENVSLKFINSDLVEYKQFSLPFQPNLSIIDVLMHNGFEKTFDLLSKKEIIEE